MFLIEEHNGKWGGFFSSLNIEMQNMGWAWTGFPTCIMQKVCYQAPKELPTLILLFQLLFS